MERAAGGGRTPDRMGAPERTPSTEKMAPPSEAENEFEEDVQLEFGPLHHEREVWGSFTIGFLFHVVLSVIFAFLFYFLCVVVQSDPESEVVDGHPIPYHVFGISTAAFGSTLVLNVVAWAWTIDSYRGRLYTFPVFVNSVSFLCDLACAMGWTPIWLCSNGRRFFMMRYLKWGITSPSLIYMYSSLSSFADHKVVYYNAVCLLMLGSGALSACTGAPHSHAYLFASLTLWIFLIQHLNQLIDNTVLNCAPDDEEYRKSLGVAKGLLLVGWIAMPVIFILAQFELVDPTVEESLYEMMDFMTKAGSASMILHSSLQTCVEKESEKRQKLLALKRNNCSHMLESMVKVHDELLISTLQTQVTSIVGIVTVAEKMLEEIRSKEGEGAAETKAESLKALHTLAQCSLASFEDFCMDVMSGDPPLRSTELLDVGDLLRKIFLVLQSRMPLSTMGQLQLENSVEQVFYVRASAALVQQVLFSLLSFVLHSMSTAPSPRHSPGLADQRRLKVSLDSLAYERGDCVVVKITDEFVPDPQTRDQLVQILNSESRLGENAQLPSLLKSIAVSKAIAERMGGALTLDLPRGGGPSFTLTLPAGTRIARSWNARVRSSRLSSPAIGPRSPADSGAVESMGLRRRIP